jgi:hypothetical protein
VGLVACVGGHDRYLPHCFKFIICFITFNIRHNLDRATDSALERTTNTCKVVPVHALKAYGGIEV